MSVTDSQLVDALASIMDPELRRGIHQLGMLRGAAVAGDRAHVVIAMPAEDHPTRAALDALITESVSALGLSGVDIDFIEMSEDEQAALRSQLIGDPGATAGSQSAHGHAEGRSISFADVASKTRVLLIASGKGGVGKSSVTTNVAIALAQRGKRVAVIDADVWGFSIPRMLGAERGPVVIDQMVVPVEANGVRMISMGFFAREDQPVIWRGPMLHKALEQFLTDVFWD